MSWYPDREELLQRETDKRKGLNKEILRGRIALFGGLAIALVMPLVHIFLQHGTLLPEGANDIKYIFEAIPLVVSIRGGLNLNQAKRLRRNSLAETDYLQNRPF